MSADRRLFDSTSMTPPPAAQVVASTCTVVDEKAGVVLCDIEGDQEVIFMTMGVDIAQGYDPTISRPKPTGIWAPLQKAM
ncbi:hypothetical protein ACVWZK_002931 [Bradyrhizobium sp. GM0.4]